MIGTSGIRITMTLVADYNFAPGLFHITFICVSGEIVRKKLAHIDLRKALSENLRHKNCPARMLSGNLSDHSLGYIFIKAGG